MLIGTHFTTSNYTLMLSGFAYFFSVAYFNYPTRNKLKLDMFTISSDARICFQMASWATLVVGVLGQSIVPGHTLVTE